MGQPVVRFEIIGNDPAVLRGYYGELFGWEFATAGAPPARHSHRTRKLFPYRGPRGESR